MRIAFYKMSKIMVQIIYFFFTDSLYIKYQIIGVYILICVCDNRVLKKSRKPGLWDVSALFKNHNISLILHRLNGKPLTEVEHKLIFQTFT